MPEFGPGSRAQLATCHPELRRLFTEVIKHADCKVLEGRRTVEQQRINIAKGVSWTMNSKHIPETPDGLSRAVDVIIYPVDWEDWKKLYWFGGLVKGIATQLGVPLRWGGDWDSDQNLQEEKRLDLVHFELVGDG